MVYKDVPQHGTDIIQLLLNHESADHRLITPGQNLFENIAAFNKRLVYSPGNTPQNFCLGRSMSRKSNAQTRLKYLTRSQPVAKISTSFTGSPVSHRTRRHGYKEKPKWY